MKNLIVVASLLFLFTGCATKMYGRQGNLTGFEKTTMSCREIDLEIAKINGFIDHVIKESKFSGRDVLAIIGDLGIGNTMEKSASLDSATERLTQLNNLRAAKKCAPQES